MSRRPAPVERPVTLTIAGSDSGGGAGIQADLKAMEAEGAFGTSVITAVTAQNTRGVERSHLLPIAAIEAQLDAVLDDFDVRAAKTGMLAATPIVELVAERAVTFDEPLIVDPVMVAESGDRLLESDAEAAYEALIAEATLVTPNADEAEVLTGITVEDESSARAAGERLVEMGADGALVTGGHFGADTVRDVLVTQNGGETFEHPRVDTDATHGTGCTLSATIAAKMAHGQSLESAVEAGTSLLERAIRYHHDVGSGPGSVHHLVALRERAARQQTAEAVHRIVDRLVAANVRELVPEVGMNVVGATPYAESISETAAVEGRITRTLDGIHPNRGVRFGASDHVARTLLSAREVDPTLRFAVNVRFNQEIERALDEGLGTLGIANGRVVETDHNGTVGSGESALESIADTSVADTSVAIVIDRGAVGREPTAQLLAPTPDELIEYTLALSDALDG